MPDITAAATGKKGLRLEVQQQLSQSLNHLKELLGEKKFSSKIKEAAKLLTKGISQEDLSKKTKKEEQKISPKTKPAETKEPGKSALKPKTKSIADATPEAKKVARRSAAGKAE